MPFFMHKQLKNIWIHQNTAEYIQIHHYMPLSGWMGMDGPIYAHQDIELLSNDHTGVGRIHQNTLVSPLLGWMGMDGHRWAHPCPSNRIMIDTNVFGCILMYSAVFWCIQSFSSWMGMKKWHFNSIMLEFYKTVRIW